MAIPPNEFWGENYYNHPPVTDRMIATAEQQLGVKLPTEYLALLRIQNGGYTQGLAHPMTRRTSWADDHVPLHSLAGIVTDQKLRTCHNILDTEYLTREWDLPSHQVLIAGEGHWWISLDYRKRKKPSVVWLNVESDQDFQIAPSFAAFLAGLVPQSVY